MIAFEFKSMPQYDMMRTVQNTMHRKTRSKQIILHADLTQQITVCHGFIHGFGR